MGNAHESAPAAEPLPEVALAKASQRTTDARDFLDSMDARIVVDFVAGRLTLTELIMHHQVTVADALSCILPTTTTTPPPPPCVLAGLACHCAAVASSLGFLRPSADLPALPAHPSSQALDSFFASQLPLLADHVRLAVAQRRRLGAAKPLPTVEPLPAESLLAPYKPVLCLAGLGPAEAWTPLFASRVDGLAFERLAQALLGYGGRVLLAVRDVRGLVFGAVSSCVWAETVVMTPCPPGGCLFQLAPALRVYAARPGRQPTVYLNSRSRTLPHGVGFGGDVRAPRLWLDQEFDACCARAFDDAYEPGALLGGVDPADEAFRVDAVEVWGLGGTQARQEQARARADHERMLLNARKVDKRAFADNEFDRDYLLANTFGGGAAAANGVKRTGS